MKFSYYFFKTPNISTLVVSGLILSLFVYCLPQFRLFEIIAVETLIFGSLIVLASVHKIILTNKISFQILLFFLLLLVVNFFSQIISPFPATDQFFKITFLSICFLFIVDYFVKVNSKLEPTLKTHVFLALLLTIYGSYIYFLGDIEGTETTSSIWKTVGRYWGFRYTPATRNDDILYIIPACLIALSYALFSFGKIKRIIYISLFIIFSTVVVLSLSRGHILALLGTTIIVLFLKFRFPEYKTVNSFQKKGFNSVSKLVSTLIGFLGLVILIIYFMGTFIPEFNVFLTLGLKLLSLFDPSAQLEYFNIEASNSTRIQIFSIGLDLLSKYPLGVGAENFVNASIAEGHGEYWGENTYLEYLINWGVLGLFVTYILFVYPLFKLYRLYKDNRRFLDLTYFAISLYLAIASLFNVTLGNFYVYVLLALIHAYIINQESLKKRQKLS